MINPKQFQNDIVRPVCKLFVPLQHDQGDTAVEAATELLMGTAMQESHLEYIHQLGAGPALGPFQMEPATHNDLWANYIGFHADYSRIVAGLAASGMDRLAQLEGNLYYAAAMCRMHYMRVPEPLPAAGNLGAQAAYYKKWYNTPLGAATVDEYINNWHELQAKLK
jgi:hypothetical protein